MNKSKMKSRASHLIWFFLVGILFLILFWRILHGVEFTDEAFYVELANRISLGNIPLYDMWEQAQTASLFLYPAIWLLRQLTGGVEGIVFVARMMYLFYACVSSMLFYLSIRTTVIEKKIAGMVSICFIFYAPFSIYCVSYNTMINCFLLIMFGIVLNIELTQSRRWWKYFCLGVVLALGALSYPTFVLFAVLQVLIYGLVTFIRAGKKDAIKVVKWMIIGGASIAGIVSLIFLITLGFHKVLIGVNGILSDSVYYAKTNLYDLIVVKLFETLRFYLVNMKMIFIICGMGILRLLKNKIPSLYLLLLGIPFYTFYKIYMIFSQAETFITVIAVGAIMVILPFMYFLSDTYKREIFIISYASILISGVGFFIVAVSSAGSGLQISHLFFIQYLAYFICLYFLLCEQRNIAHPSREGTAQLTFIFLVPILILLSCFLITSYRDVKVWKMDARIDSGVYKYLYTSRERKEYVEYLEQSLNDVDQTEKEQTVMVLHQAPYLYLFLDKKPVVPTTWGIYDLKYPTNEPVYKKYFKDLKVKPQIVIVLNDASNNSFTMWKQQAPWLTEDFLRDYKLTKEFSKKDFPHLLVYIQKRGY